MNEQTTNCTIPPAGWKCTRAAGHTGPCAAIPEDGGEGVSGWTPEPWCIHRHNGAVTQERDGNIIADFNSCKPQLSPAAVDANASRATACVNAMAGIEDPAAFVATFHQKKRDVLEADRRQLQDAIGPNGGIRLPWGECIERVEKLAAESAQLRREVEALRAVVKEHHAWHLSQAENPDGTGGADNYIDSSMYDRTAAALASTAKPADEKGGA